ncbi:hypothetical protein FRAAL6758 [Frankia alni ACN14a]|uniref:Uncharacterized protein n=1 Tax=Frankia alni (strain DSM 45986 / CECT 9034 / ACN14a) TaxID=326424 RepID=Q0RB07_FRAAA|nr:hypothetical protein FRAAL6758 [Frankia alni ACN14a]
MRKKARMSPPNQGGDGGLLRRVWLALTLGVGFFGLRRRDSGTAGLLGWPCVDERRPPPPFRFGG